MEITLEIEVMLSYLSYFMPNGITIFCPVGLEANISCEISHRKQGDVHFTSLKNCAICPWPDVQLFHALDTHKPFSL